MLPERFEPARRPALVRAAVSPTSIALAAAGVAIGVFLIHSILVAVLLGAGAWIGRMAWFALWRSLPTAERDPVDPWAVPEPWRQYVRQGQAAGERFDRTVAGWQGGPMQERVAELQARVQQGVREVWSVARQGAASAPSGTPAEALSKELQQVQAERRRPGAASGPPEALARREEAIAAQLRSARHAEEAQARVLDRLRVLTARLDEAVTRVLELGLDRASIEQEAGAVDGVVDELASLHQGLLQAELPPGPPTSSAAP